MTGKPDHMHVVMITNVVAPDKLGGLERYVRELSRQLVRQGNAVTVISKMTSPDQSHVEAGQDGVKIMRYSVPPKDDRLFAVKYPYYVAKGVRETLGAALAAGSPAQTIVHGHFPLPMLPLLMKGIPYVYTCHAPVYKEILDERQGSYRLPRWAQGALVRVFKYAERFVLKRATRVVTLSRFVSREVCALTKLDPDTILQIPGGLDTDWFSPSPGTVAEGLREAPAPLIFTARRLVSRTGVEELLRAMPLILDREPGTRLAIAGDGPLRPRLQQVLEELDLEHAVSILGRISELELRDWYRKADIAVTPTRNLEGFGLSTVEAMACGTVPLVTPVGANPEIVGQLSPILIAPGLDARGIADGIISLWHSTEYESLRSSVRTAVHPQLSWPSVCNEYLSLYRDVTGHRPADSPAPPTEQVSVKFKDSLT